MNGFDFSTLLDSLRRAPRRTATPTQANATIHDTLIEALTRHGLDPEFVSMTGTPCILVPTVDSSAILISNDYCDDLNLPLAEYQGLLAYRYPLRYDPTRPPTDYQPEMEDLVEVYVTEGPVNGVKAALKDLGDLTLAVAQAAEHPLPEAEVADLLLAALKKEGLTGRVDSLGGCREGVVVELHDHTHIRITDTEGVQITYPVTGHQGLIAYRYPNDDVTQRIAVYESHRTNAIPDVQDAAAAVRAEANRPLTALNQTQPATGDADALTDQIQRLADQPVSAVLLSLLRSQDWECSLRALGDQGAGVHIPLGPDAHILITDPEDGGLGSTMEEHAGLYVARVSERASRHTEIYSTDNAGAKIHDTFSAVADLMQAVAAIDRSGALD
ncbi:hypothetical protein ABZ234_08045 [Nocardiopsis sp. NPDC006198]|uniref:hypothetical protein n=1 Tax=Nocardiopsis sp. NPDC006198 TaxID=3154472 RepID=UPI0033B47DB0